jgi:hypothetical protein
MIVNKNTLIPNDNPVYNLGFVENLQKEIDKKSAKAINKHLASVRNDLGLCVNEKAIQDLSVFYNILEKIKYCSPCFSENDIKDIVSLVKNKLNNV